MKVILNVDAISHPLTGIGQYTLQLGSALQQLPAVERIRFFSSHRWLEDIQQTAGANQWLSMARDWLPMKSLALKVYAQKRNRRFQQLTTDLQDHVLHSPNFILLPFEGRSVATFHDLSFVHHRQTQPAYRLRYLDQAIPQTLQQADVLLTPSAHVKQEIVDHYGYAAEQIQVTPLGVTPGFQPHNAAACEATLQSHQLPYKRFVLSVATTEPRKNLERLLQAYAQLPQALQQQFPLVLVGSTGWLNRALHHNIKKLVSQGRIKSLGYVDQTQLQQLYAAARLTAFPSLYEGFGLPIIESMASGTAVLTSAHSAMQEVAGGHALLCHPEDTDDMATQLQRGLEDDAWLTRAERNGLEHSQSFTWSQCAALTAGAYAAD